MPNLSQPDGAHRASTLRQREDLPERGEPKQATNSVMNFAIVAAIVIGIAMFAWGSVIMKTRQYTDKNTPQSAPLARVNGQPANIKDTAIKPKNDVSNVDKQAVSGDAIFSGQIGDQK